MSENGNGSRTITEIIDDGVTVNEALDKAFYRLYSSIAKPTCR